MTKMKFFTGLLVALATSSLLLVGAASAHDFRSGDNTKVAQDEVVNSTLFIAGSTIDIAGEVQGDVFCAGQTIAISGTVHGDVICGGQTIDISGVVHGDVRLAGQTITISGEVNENATVAGQTFTVSGSGHIDRDLSLGTDTTTINGAIGRDIAVGGSTVTIDGKVGRDIKGSVNKLELATDADIVGNVNYTSPNLLTQASSAQVGGTITYTESDESSKNGAVFGFTFGWFLYWFLAMLLVSMALILLFPTVFQSVTEQGAPRPWKALLVGFAASIIAPIAIFVIGITVIGIPLALLLALIWFVIVILSGPFTAYLVGRRILSGSKKALHIMFVGSAVLLLAYFIPLIGFIALLFSFWIGAGMILLELTRRTPKPAYEVTKEKSSHTKKKK